MSKLNIDFVRKKIGDKVYSKIPIKEEYIESEVIPQKKVIRDNNYRTNGEILIVVKDIDECNLILDSSTTEHIIIKALTRVIIKPSQNYIDEFYSEIEINKGACVEFYLLENNWYIVSSDGLKLE